MTEKNKALQKIRKCLALAESSNPHEAAAALRQADALMRKHELDQADVALSEIVESGAKASGSCALPLWENMLVICVAEICGCRAMFSHGEWLGRQFASGPKSNRLRKTYAKGKIVFVGRTDRAQLAAYSFESLRRQLRKARKEFSQTYQVTAAQIDAFASGWVQEVSSKVRDLVTPLADVEMIDAYMRRKNGGIEPDNAEIRDKAGLTRDRKQDGSIAAAFHHGVDKAGDAQLHAGIGAASSLQIGFEPG